MVLLFYVEDCQSFSPSKYRIVDVYTSIQADFRIEDDEQLDKYIEIYLYCCSYCPIYLRNPYLTHIIINMILCIENTEPRPTTTSKLPPVKNEGAQLIKN